RQHGNRTSAWGILFVVLALAFSPQGARAEEEDLRARLKAMDGYYQEDEKLPGRPIYSLKLGGSSADETQFSVLARLTSLRELDLSNCQITDATLSHLRKLSKLSDLDLSGAKISDAGLDALLGLKELTVLKLEGTEITDAGVAKLLTIPTLESLH